jgi:hypothetical protein
MSFPPRSPNTQPTTPDKTVNSSLRTWSPTKKSFPEKAKLTVIPNSNLRNRSTPNLQAPDLSIEDLGKINAFYAPPPPALVVKALNETPRRRTASASSGPKLKTRFPLSPEFSGPTPNCASKPLLVPVQNNVNTQHPRKEKGIPIALPLSPIGGASGKYDCEEDTEFDVIYLTVENVLDEESGETILRLVEVPM